MTEKTTGFLHTLNQFRDLLLLCVMIIGGTVAAMSQDARLERIENSMVRMQDVQAYVFENQAWQDDVLEHLAQKNPGAPARPEHLRAQQLGLLAR